MTNCDGQTFQFLLHQAVVVFFLKVKNVELRVTDSGTVKHLS